MSVIYGLSPSDTSDAPARKMRLWYAPFVFVLAAASMALATPRAADYFEYHAALGTPLLAQLRWYVPGASEG